MANVIKFNERRSRDECAVELVGNIAGNPILKDPYGKTYYLLALANDPKMKTKYFIYYMGPVGGLESDDDKTCDEILAEEIDLTKIVARAYVVSSTSCGHEEFLMSELDAIDGVEYYDVVYQLRQIVEVTIPPSWSLIG